MSILCIPSSDFIIPSQTPDARPTTSSSTATDIDDWSAFFTMPHTPPVISTPDDIFAGSWSTPLDIVAPPNMSHDSSSPTDFAFEPPSDNKTSSTGFAYTPSIGNGYSNALGGYSSASSFSSSASGSYGGTSFSSTDALPAISRDFSRPNVQQSKRPATAGGVMQSRLPFGNSRTMEKVITEEPSFSNPFGSAAAGPSYTETIDPRYAPSNRRASEGHGSVMAPPAWPVQASNPLAAPASTTPFDPYSQLQHQGYRPSYTTSNRPQTSDGLPSFGGPTPLPSARSVVGSLSNLTSLTSLTTVQPALQPAAHIRSAYGDSTTPFSRSEPRSGQPSVPRSEHGIDFAPIGGPAPKKRPRRRFDEIERLYRCGFGGCEKSYGTLNHLNAHVAMQQHGEKRLPSEFKDMRKAWRKKKREATAAASNNQNGNWARSSVSSESDFDRRTSSASAMSASSAGRFPSTAPGYKYESRPTTSSSITSSADGRQYYSQAAVPPFGYDQAMNPSSLPPGLQSRRDSAPQHVSMPYSSQASMGFRPADDGITPTPQNPFPYNFSMNYSMNAANAVQPQQYQQHQPQQQPMQQSMRPGTGGFPFQTLTQPMPMVNAPQHGQFAFQR